MSEAAENIEPQEQPDETPTISAVPDAPAPDDAPTSVWGDDWRQNIAKELGQADDEKLLKRLERFTTPTGAVKSWLAAEQKISSGELKRTLGENASDEELANWRKENGIPESADKYSFDLPDGTVFGEEDKAGLSAFAEAAHGQNMSQQQMQAMLGWYQNQITQADQAQQEADVNYQKDSEDTLRGEWGGEYRANVNAIAGIMQRLPEGVRGEIQHARLPDGSKLGNHPDFLRFMADIAREVNPIGTLLPGSGPEAAASMQARKAELRTMMADPSSAYWKEPSLQAEYNKILQIESKMK